jgi:DNA excision repair protein ERCC-6
MRNLTFAHHFNNSLSPIKVLFCKLTVSQRRAYEEFIKSKEMDSIMAGRRQVLFGIDIVRKICNHPDILYRERANEVTKR